MKKVYQVAIVGTGGAGLLALLAIAHTKKIPPQDILLIDPYHDGGDLQRKWPTVISNTTWGQMLAIVESKGFPRQDLPEPWTSLDPTQPTPLKHTIHLLRYCTKSFMKDCEVVYGKCRGLEQSSLDQSIQLTVHMNSHEKEVYTCLRLVLAIGSDPRQDTYPIPTLPLDIALDPQRLSSYIGPSSHVMVIGTAHSGTLVIRNLRDQGASVGAFYRTKQPFLFARDGEYDGIKQESEKIADDILAEKYSPQVSLYPITNTAQVVRWSKKADWIIYATGFERREFPIPLTYDGGTGKIDGFAGVWGFGIGFPNRAPDGVHWDVSLPAFASHIDAQIPKLLETFYS
jgi:cation diffusion facilitator CzcD-associated flavoprotein CzcO